MAVIEQHKNDDFFVDPGIQNTRVLSSKEPQQRLKRTAISAEPLSNFFDGQEILMKIPKNST